MRAIILAAGSGTRLSPLTDSCPKCLVRVGGRPMIDYQLAALEAVGVTDLVLVVGYEQDQVRRHCGTRATYVENPDYATTNSIYSLHLAAAAFDVATFLFNCDIIFHPDILRRMLDSGAPNAVAVDSHAELTAGEMNVVCRADGVISEISKSVAVARAQAQSVQLALFCEAGARTVRAAVKRLVEEARNDVFPTSAYGPLLEAGSLTAVEAGDLPWGEIDSLDDRDRVEREVLPRLPGR